MKTDETLHFQPIGLVHSCFREKFGIPRQPGLIPEARARLQLLPPYNRPEAVAGLEGFSHLWLVFVFHQAMREEWKATVRPPRLGGNERVGVFASRAPYRPNPIGLSAVAFEGVEEKDGQLFLRLSGVDLVDGTPVLDIKPYVPYTDALPDARAGFAPEPPGLRAKVVFSPAAQAQLAQAKTKYPDIQSLIEKVIGLDPRPAYYNEGSTRKRFGMKLWDWDVRWTLEGDRACVTELVPLD
jgi:tRNA-Thr(GGU) m(6)t(6)A37 methyltransferase TsaA